MPEFKLNGTIYDIPEDIVDQFKKDNPNAEAVGKTTPPKEDNQGVPAEVNAAPESPVGVSVLEDTSLDLQNPKTRKELGFNYGEEQKYLRDKTIPERTQKIKIGLGRLKN